MTQAQPPIDPRHGPWASDFTTPTGRVQGRPGYAPPPEIPGEVIRVFDLPSQDPRQPPHRVYVVREPAAPRRSRYWLVHALAIAALLVALTQWHSVAAFFEHVTAIGQGDMESDIKGLLSAGLIGAVLIAIVRIATAGSRQ